MDNWLGALRKERPFALAVTFACAGFAMTTSALAAERKLTGPEIREYLTDHTFKHADNTKEVLQTFRAQGVTFYYEGSEQSEGRWEVRDDKYCAQWPPRKTWTCYAVAIEGTVLTFITAVGVRYPVERVN